MDLQFVLNTYACAAYCTSYISKSHRGMIELLRSADKEAQQLHSTIKDQLRTISNRFLNTVEIGAPEAIYICLQLPLKWSSRAVVFINTNTSDKRLHLLKPRAVLLEMDDEDDNIRSKDLIDKYVERPDELNDVSLSEFACFYTKTAKSSYSQKK